MALQETVAVPEFATLAGVIAPQLSPVGTVSVRLIVPGKPLIEAMVTVDVADIPTVTADGEVDAIVKSVTVTVIATEWESDPLAPFTVTLYVIADVDEHDSVDVWDVPKVTLVGFSVQVTPDGDADDVRATVPVNPPNGFTVIVDVPVEPTSVATLDGDAEIEKSWIAGPVTFTSTIMSWMIPVEVDPSTSTV